MENNDVNLDLFEILTKQNYEKVYKVVYLYTKDKWVSEDAVQQAFVIGYNKLAQLKSKDNFASWIISIALNEAKRILNKSNNHKITSLTDLNLNTASDNLESKVEQKDEVDNVLKKLKKKEKEILVLRYYADLSIRQIADLLGLNLSNAKVRLHRAKESFRNLIIREFDETREVDFEWLYQKKNLSE